MYTFINNIDDLAFLNTELLSKSVLGVDTEFRRTTKDNMRLGLLQINDGEEIYLIDTVLINNPYEHASFLYSNSVTKVFHSCKEDLEAIYAWTNKIMCNVFDTQIANSLLEDDYSIGYQGLVEKKLGIVLEKKETRSNWIKRPLTDAQLKYAALDVEYLIHIYKFQSEALAESKKLKWLNEDIEKIITTIFDPEVDHNDLTRVISKSEEIELLLKFNKTIERIAEDKKINSTLFFSKKAQKDFLRKVFIDGIEPACEEITNWRRKLIKDDLIKILK